MSDTSQTFAIGRIKRLPENDDVLDELKSTIQSLLRYGSSAPTGETPGSVYFQYDESAVDNTRVYIKVNGEWR